MELEKFYGTLHIRNIENKEVFHLHYILGYYETEPRFTHTVSLKKEPLKKFENEVDFFPSGKLFM